METKMELTDRQKKDLRNIGVLHYSQLDNFSKAGALDLLWDYIKLGKEQSKMRNFIDKVDDRDEDPDYTKEEFDKEDQTYQEYSKKLSESETKAESLRKEIDEKLSKCGFQKHFDLPIIV